jgi:hypothetical protein
MSACPMSQEEEGNDTSDSKIVDYGYDNIENCIDFLIEIETRSLS